MIDFYPAASESGACWEAFLGDLYKRGLKGGPCELVATDGGTGLHQALQIVYPKIVLQRCWAHKTRNVLDKVKKIDQPAVKKGFNPNQPCSQPSRSDSGLLAIIGALAKGLSQSGGLLKERFRAAPEFLSNQKAPTVEPVENHQPHRKSVSRSEKKNQAHGCDGSYPESTTNRFRCVPSPKSKLASATLKIYTEVLTLPAGAWKFWPRRSNSGL